MPHTGWSETERVEALVRYGILDTPPEPDFDHITRVASLVCKAPIAVVTLVAESRQWFKSEIGLGVRETPLNVSICAHAILQEDLFVAPDLTRDSRFDCNPLVTGDPYLRFYAGARLNTPEGLPIGTVCVLDYAPRPEGVTEEQREVLLALSRQTMAYLEARRVLAQRDLLARELSHRIKNVFTVVNALASASSRESPEAAAFARTFRNRVSALGRAQDYVLPSSAGGLTQAKSVGGLLDALLAPYSGAARVSIDGDDAALGEAAATALAMIIHEYATNAVKYGALSTEGGTVAVRAAHEGDDFTIEWTERGGPPVSGEPSQRGFGYGMVERVARDQLRGSLTERWLPAGLTVRLSVPAAQLLR